MKYFSFILLMMTSLLNGCFSGKEYPSGLLNSSELRRMQEEQRMQELKQNKKIRLGVSAENQKNIADVREKIEAKGWKVQIIVCPGNRLTGLLRSGSLDMIYLKDCTEKTAEPLSFYYLAPSYLIKNQLLYQELKGM